MRHYFSFHPNDFHRTLNKRVHKYFVFISGTYVKFRRRKLKHLIKEATMVQGYYIKASSGTHFEVYISFINYDA